MAWCTSSSDLGSTSSRTQPDSGQSTASQAFPERALQVKLCRRFEAAQSKNDITTCRVKVPVCFHLQASPGSSRWLQKEGSTRTSLIWTTLPFETQISQWNQRAPSMWWGGGIDRSPSSALTVSWLLVWAVSKPGHRFRVRFLGWRHLTGRHTQGLASHAHRGAGWELSFPQL